MKHKLKNGLFKFRRVFSIGSQILMIVAANRIAFSLRFDGPLPEWAALAFWQMLPWLVVIRGLTFVPFRLYEGLWRYTSIYDLRAITAAITTSSVLFYALVRSPLGPAVYPRSVFITDAVLLLLMLGGVRLTRRIVAEFSTGRGGKRVLIFGAGDAGELVVRDMKSNPSYGYTPVGFVDDDVRKVGRRIHGVPVLGTRDDLAKILAEHRPEEVLIAIPGAEPANMRQIVRALESFKIPIKTLPRLLDIIDGKVGLGEIRSLSVEDLLSRAPVGLDQAPVRQLIRGRRVMVTGAGGSIGSELCRQIARLHPASLVMFERYENSLHAIRIELEDEHRGFNLHPVVGDVADTVCVGGVMQRFQPEIVFHAAAHKHVPLMEENPCEAIKNNVRGTRLLAQAAEFYGVDRFIFISTDKAVNPTSVMGGSKRLAELVLQTQAIGSGTSFSVVRFGNVLGSNGSVVPRFLDQIKHGGPVTITHPEMRRFFMLIPEAVQLVMHAAAQAESGTTYVLEMGEQVKLLDMARDLIRLSGFVPEEEIPISFIGLRPGEKLYEELVGRDEDVGPSAIEKILRVTSRTKPNPDLFVNIDAIESFAAQGDSDVVRMMLKDLIPEFDAEPAERPAAPAERTPMSTAVPAEAGDAQYQLCPSCSGAHVRRSRTKGIVERVKREFSEERVFRCDACGWRGWLMPLVFSDAQAAEVDGEPDLSVVDRSIGSLLGVARQAFSPRHLN
ncbi:MAG TPA: nucleoside-diphosphate sugar epimerase/dehydratase [Vicinamibacterales bacterium]|nr:nucleoside-diphosphate sugar epimerase/dehydratase [Vicinamibacterales bacterium]